MPPGTWGGRPETPLESTLERGVGRWRQCYRACIDRQQHENSSGWLCGAERVLSGPKVWTVRLRSVPLRETRPSQRLGPPLQGIKRRQCLPHMPHHVLCGSKRINSATAADCREKRPAMAAMMSSLTPRSVSSLLCRRAVACHRNCPAGRLIMRHRLSRRRRVRPRQFTLALAQHRAYRIVRLCVCCQFPLGRDEV